MSLSTRLKKLEGERTRGHVVDSAEDRAAVERLFNCVCVHEHLTARAEGRDDPNAPPGPPYETLLRDGRVTETPRYVASLREQAERRATFLLDRVVEDWRAALPNSPRRAFYAALWLRSRVAEPVPGDYARYRPGLDDSLFDLLDERPAAVAAAKRHGGAREAAAWADAFEREHPEEAARIAERTDGGRLHHRQH